VGAKKGKNMQNVMGQAPVQQINHILDYMVHMPKHVPSLRTKHRIITINRLPNNINERVISIRDSLRELENMYDEFVCRQALEDTPTK